nr:hypothetical protein [Tanacetum cinerariifolium]
QKEDSEIWTIVENLDKQVEFRLDDDNDFDKLCVDPVPYEFWTVGCWLKSPTGYYSYLA